jgi:hypothetical protein
MDHYAEEILRVFGTSPDEEEHDISPMSTFICLGEGRTTQSIPSHFQLRAEHTYYSRSTWEQLSSKPENLTMDIVEMTWPTNSDHLWLPAKISVGHATGSEPYPVRLLSYINNLHPDPSLPSGRLYPVIENILSKFIPLFEKTLSGGSFGRSESLRPEGYWDPPEPRLLNKWQVISSLDAVCDNYTSRCLILQV